MTPSSHAEAAAALLRDGNTSEAETACRAALAIDGDDADALRVLARIAFSRGEQAEAVALARRAAAVKPASARIHHDLGTLLLLKGEPAAALAAFEDALRLASDDIDSLTSAALALVHLGRAAEAETLLLRAVTIAPGHAPAWGTLAVALAALGRPEQALEACARRVALQPDNAEAHAQKGALLGRLRRWPEALATYVEATRLAPTFADAWCAIAHVLDTLGRREDALAAFDRGLTIRPDFAEALSDRAALLRELGRTAEAAADVGRALAINPRLAAALNEKALLLNAQGRVREALIVLTHLIEIHPQFAPAFNNRGLIWLEQGQLDQALLDFDAAIRADPSMAEAYDNRGVVLSTQRRVGEATAAYRQALAIDPQLASAHNNLGLVLLDEGRAADAAAAFRRAIEIKPDFALAHSNYLWCLNHDPALDEAALFSAHQDWAARHGHPPAAFTQHANDPDPDRPLRVGLVSPDFRRHPVGFAALPLFRCTDQTRLRLYTFSGVSNEDDITKVMRGLSCGWKVTVGRTDRELAEMIRADGIDILVDLAGHSSGNRLTCLALRPAPVQVHWAVGYPFTTAVPAIDYALWDKASVPPGSERWFTETVVRLPHARLCFEMPAYTPAVKDPPMGARGHVTFGSFNNTTKLGAHVIALWARVLHAVPDARLLLSWPNLIDEAERRRLAAAFARHGIPLARLELIAGGPGHEAVLADYAEVDIALDPFPFTGGFTTFEALWMGVPVVTLAGTRPVSRQALPLFTALGREDWVARDADAYVRIAVGLAGDPERLLEMRHGQRQRLAASPVCDAARFARDFEAALREMWQNWCSTRQSPAPNGGAG